MKNALLALVVSLVSLELFSFAATQANLLLFNDYPEIYQPRFSGHKWRTQKDLWGSWHKLNATDRHRSTCFDVRYASNAIGARDTAFKQAKPDGQTRYVLVGDSFAEGFGVNFEEMVQTQLEKLINVDIYNFGSDGYFGPVQYYLVYKHLAKQFEHDGVILFFCLQMISQTMTMNCGRIFIHFGIDPTIRSWVTDDTASFIPNRPCQQINTKR